MGSSFLTTMEIGLGIYSLLQFFKIIIQFGLPNHPGRFSLYLVSMCVAGYFTMQALASLGFMAPLDFMRLRSLFLVVGSFTFLIQLVALIGNFTHIQQKVISRVPLILGIMVYGFMPDQADFFFILAVILGGAFLSVSVGKARYQKRLYFKMMLFLALVGAAYLSQIYWVYVIGQIFLFPSLFYFFILEKSFGVKVMMEKFQNENAGAKT